MTLCPICSLKGIPWKQRPHQRTETRVRIFPGPDQPVSSKSIEVVFGIDYTCVYVEWSDCTCWKNMARRIPFKS